jgi:phosphoribosylamine--glycine ligase
MDNVIYSSGGRVLCVTALGENTQIAKERSYESIKEIEWEDSYYRTDIGYRAVKREIS